MRILVCAVASVAVPLAARAAVVVDPATGFSYTRCDLVVVVVAGPAGPVRSGPGRARDVRVSGSGGDFVATLAPVVLSTSTGSATAARSASQVVSLSHDAAGATRCDVNLSVGIDTAGTGVVAFEGVFTGVPRTTYALSENDFAFTVDVPTAYTLTAQSTGRARTCFARIDGVPDAAFTEGTLTGVLELGAYVSVVGDEARANGAGMIATSLTLGVVSEPTTLAVVAIAGVVAARRRRVR